MTKLLSLDERIASTLAGTATATALAALLSEARIADQKAESDSQAARATALDPATPQAAVTDARKAMEDAHFTRERLGAAITRLEDLRCNAERREQQEAHGTRVQGITQRRDAMVTELRDRYPGLVNDLMDLLLRMQAVDAEARSFGLPTSEDLARPGAVPGGTPATPLSMCRLIDFERQWHAHVWVDGRHIRNIGGDPVPAPAAAPTAPATQTVPTSLVTLTNPTDGQRMIYFDYANASHFIQPRETLHGVRVLDTQLPKLREYLSVEVSGAGEPVQRPA